MKHPALMREPDAIAEGYEGRRVWSVLWKDRIPATVAAPTKEEAMIAAARFWGVRWQALDFYSEVVITKIA